MQGVFVTTVLRRSAVAAVAACAVLTAGGTAAFAGAGTHASAPAAANRTISGGKTTVQLNSKTINALAHDKFSLAPTGKAKVTKAFALVFPVTGGNYGTHPGRIVHTGGIKISKGSKSVTIKNLIVKTNSATATAVVTGKGRIGVVTLGSPQEGGPSSFGGYSVSISKSGIKLLDKVFKTKAFKKHPTLGVGSTTLKFKK
jgi:hypothetical protein